LSQGGAAHGQFAVQVKGLHYFLPELVAQESAQDLSWFSTIYLAPHNYHRVHSPISGRLKTITHVSGELWPVNAPFVQIVPQLFVKNERLIFEIEMNPGELCYLVMVGALNVGRIESPFWSDLTTNELHNMHWFSSQTKSKDCNEEIKIGDELGTFMLGSTVVLVLNQAAEATFDSLSVKVGNIKLGQSLLS
jgi:phosphatidylserine decarboxylase